MNDSTVVCATSCPSDAIIVIGWESTDTRNGYRLPEPITRNRTDSPFVTLYHVNGIWLSIPCKINAFFDVVIGKQGPRSRGGWGEAKQNLLKSFFLK